jgi:hypothetical protein
VRITRNIESPGRTREFIFAVMSDGWRQGYLI